MADEGLRPKYPAEFMLEFRSVDRFVFRVSDIYTFDEDVRREHLKRLDECHIYMLARRPRLSAVPGTLRVLDASVGMDLEFRVRGQLGRASFSVPRDAFGPEEVTFAISDYPHRTLISRNVEGQAVVETLLANFVHLMPEVPNEVKDLEVIYVGKGLRNSARDRIVNHAKLQEILARLHSDEPDDEVFALAWAFDFQKPVLVFAGAPEILGEPVKQRRRRATAYRPSLEDRVALIEASCISYFRPSRYNTHYLDFPNRDYKILAPVYAADFSQIIVRLDNTNIGGQRIYSQGVAPAAIHHIVIDFRRLEGKYSPFAVPDEM